MNLPDIYDILWRFCIGVAILNAFVLIVFIVGLISTIVFGSHEVGFFLLAMIVCAYTIGWAVE